MKATHPKRYFIFHAVNEFPSLKKNNSEGDLTGSFIPVKTEESCPIQFKTATTCTLSNPLLDNQKALLFDKTEPFNLFNSRQIPFNTQSHFDSKKRAASTMELIEKRNTTQEISELKEEIDTIKTESQPLIKRQKICIDEPHLDVTLDQNKSRASIKCQNDALKREHYVKDSMGSYLVNLRMLRELGLIDIQSDKTPLMKAIILNNEREIECLIKNACDVSRVDKEGKTALMHAIIQNTPMHIIKTLITAGIGLNIADQDGKTALIHAVILINIDAITALLSALGVDKNTADHEGKTALMHAVTSFNIFALIYLLESNVNINVVDKKGKTALLLATESRNESAFLILQKYKIPLISMPHL